MRQYFSVRWVARSWAGGLLLLLVAPPCRADLLQVVLDTRSPVTQSFNGTLTYDASMGNFHSEMTPLNFNADFLPGGFALFSGDPKLTIDLSVDQNGGFVSSGLGVRLTGTLDLNGVMVVGTDTNPLLFGRITNFGAEAPGPPTRDFDGLFTIDGGQLTTVMVPVSGGGSVVPYAAGGLGGFILEAENVTGGTLGDFTQDFSSTSVKSDLGALVAEPGTLALGLVGAAVLAGLGLLKKRAGRSCCEVRR